MASKSLQKRPKKQKIATNKSLVSKLLKKVTEPDVVIDDSYIVLKIRKDVAYEVPLATCNTWAKIVGWQLHLSDKRWATKSKIIDFTYLAAEYHGLPISRP